MSTDINVQIATQRDQYRALLYGGSCTRAHLTAFIFQLLLIPRHGQFTDFFSNLLKNSLESDPNWQPEKTSKALKHLETYALNLYSSPWREEFKTIKIYTGVYRLKVALYIKDAEGVLRLMGYVPKPDDSMALTLAESVDRDQLLEVAFTLFMLQAECDIYRQIYERVKAQGHTMAQVHECRSGIGGGIEECIDWIRDRYGRTKKLVVDHTLVDIGPSDGTQMYVPDRRANEDPSHKYDVQTGVDVLAGMRGLVPARHRNEGSLVTRSDGRSTSYDVYDWMQSNTKLGMRDALTRTLTTGATNDNDIYAPMTAEQHRMRSYDAVRTTGTSLPVKDRTLSAGLPYENAPTYVEFLARSSVGIGHTAGSAVNTGTMSMDSVRNPTDAQHVVPNRFPMSFSVEAYGQHGGLTTSRSRDAVTRRADFGVRTNPDTFTAKRCSLYDNVDPADACDRTARESSVGKRGPEMTLL